MVYAIKHFRHYLYGRPFTVRTDHNALKWLQSFKEPEGQVARWLETFAQYDYNIEHRPGRSTRMPMPCPETLCQLQYQITQLRLTQWTAVTKHGFKVGQRPSFSQSKRQIQT